MDYFCKHGYSVDCCISENALAAKGHCDQGGNQGNNNGNEYRLKQENFQFIPCGAIWMKSFRCDGKSFFTFITREKITIQDQLMNKGMDFTLISRIIKGL